MISKRESLDGMLCRKASKVYVRPKPILWERTAPSVAGRCSVRVLLYNVTFFLPHACRLFGNNHLWMRQIPMGTATDRSQNVRETLQRKNTKQQANLEPQERHRAAKQKEL
jgi:hypothetical protein